MPDKSGVEIYKRFYPWPDRFRLGDPVLVREVTGMRWPDFVQALEEIDQDEAPDQVVLAGLIAVAFWQGNPTMTRDKARRAIEKIPQDDVDIVEGDEGDDVGPPVMGGAGAGASPPTTSSESGGSLEVLAETEIHPGFTSDETNLNGSGHPGSVVITPESLPA